MILFVSARSLYVNAGIFFRVSEILCFHYNYIFFLDIVGPTQYKLLTNNVQLTSFDVCSLYMANSMKCHHHQFIMKIGRLYYLSKVRSCQYNDYSLVDSLFFIDSQDYRYSEVQNNQQVHELP